MGLPAKNDIENTALVTHLSEALARRAERRVAGDLRAEGPPAPLRGGFAGTQVAKHPALDTGAADSLVSTMRLVKAARFNAAGRLELKQTVSLFTQSTVALYFVGLAVWQAVYVGQIDEQTNRLATFVQIVSSVFTLLLGLLEAMNDYKMKAHHLHNCALSVSELAQELKILRPSEPAVVQEFRRRYNDLLRACPVNHSRLDYNYARCDAGGEKNVPLSLRAQYVADVFGLYVLFLAVPPLVWWLHA